MDFFVPAVHCRRNSWDEGLVNNIRLLNSNILHLDNATWTVHLFFVLPLTRRLQLQALESATYCSFRCHTRFGNEAEQMAYRNFTLFLSLNNRSYGRGGYADGVPWLHVDVSRSRGWEIKGVGRLNNRFVCPKATWESLPSPKSNERAEISNYDVCVYYM